MLLPDPESVASAWHTGESPGVPWGSLGEADRRRYRSWAAKALAGWSAREIHEDWCEQEGRELAWDDMSQEHRSRLYRLHFVASAHTLGVHHLLDGSSVTAM